MASTIFAGLAALTATSAFAQAPAPGQTPSDSPVGPQTPAGAPSFGPAPASTLPENSNGQPPAAVAEVVVTGSRIPQATLTSASPLTVVNDQEIKLSGASNIENLLNSLPQVTADQASSVSNGSSGTATVNLRDLGPARTLVLVDGKRLMPGDPSTPFADLNNIPSALIDRVEVVTGGASAVYGADAVAGVVNFVMKHDFQGVRLDAQYGFDEHDNNNPIRSSEGVQGISNFPLAPGNILQSLSYDVTAIFGVNAPDDKGNVTGYLSYRNLRSVTQDKYDVSSCTSLATNVHNADSYIYDGRKCSGSSNSQYGRFNNIAPTGGLLPAGANTGTYHDATNGTQAFTTSSVPAYNYAPQNYFQRPEDRYTGGFNAHYRINDMIEVYSDFMFADDHTVAQIAPSGLFAGTGSNGTSYYQVNCNNPLMTAAQQVAMCGTAAAGTSAIVNTQIGYRFAGYNRQDDLRHTNYKIDIGARGDLGGGWHYDTYLQYGTSIYSEEYVNDASIKKIQNALLVNPDGTCMSDSNACVPLNIFQTGGVSKAALGYVLTPGFKNGETTEQIANFSLTGDLGQYGIKSPWASEGVGTALGTEYRREGLTLNTDQEFTSGDLSGQGGPTIGDSGSFDVYELFGEIRVPIATDKPFAKNLSLDAGYRFSDYSTSGTTNTYKLEGQWSPTADFGFRAGYNRAVRAPNVVELFSPSAVQDVGANDPCAGVAVAADYSAACVASFASAAKKAGTTAQALANSITNIQQCPAAQCSQLVSGNADLQPEKADTYSVGIVFTPREWFLRGFTGSIDYYNIFITQVISAPNSQTILNECVAGITTACDLIQRDPSQGIIYGSTGYVTDTTINGGFQRTQGVDFAANYRIRPTDWGLPNYGSLNFSFIGTYTAELRTQPIANGPSYDCAGLYGPVCLTPLPKWRHKLRMTYTMPHFPVDVSIDWRHVGAVSLDANKANPLLANKPSGITDTADNHIHPFDYFDLSATWKIRDNLNARVGVSNVFDKDPPILDSTLLPASAPPTGNGNTYPGVYDALGRTLFVGLSADF